MIWAIVGVVVLLAVFGVYLASTAGRLDRLHHRVRRLELGDGDVPDVPLVHPAVAEMAKTVHRHATEEDDAAPSSTTLNNG